MRLCRGRDLAESSMYGDLERVKLCLSRGSNFSRFVNNFCHLVLWKYMERKRAETLSKLLMPGEIANPGSVTPLFYRKQETPTVPCSWLPKRSALCRVLHPSPKLPLHATGTCSHYICGSRPSRLNGFPAFPQGVRIKPTCIPSVKEA